MNSSAPASISHYFSPSQELAPQEYSRHAVNIRVGEKSLALHSGIGVFSKDKLDSGSRVLLKTLLASDSDFTSQKICDLGCGWGALGCFLAAHYPDAQISMCDINPRAAHLAFKNARHNQLENTHVWCGDELSAMPAGHFAGVVCNPPIRAGNLVIEKMFNGAHRCLETHGMFWAVIRTSQGAKSWNKRLQNLFGNCQTVAIESGYRILKCEKS